MKRFLVLLAVTMCLAGSATAQVLINDQFSDNDRNNDAVVETGVTDVDQPGELDFGWYCRSNPGTNMQVVTDSVLGGNALHVASTDPFWTAAASSATLANEGDKLTASMRIHFTTVANLRIAGLRMGIYNNKGTVATADNAASPTFDDFGYEFETSTGTGDAFNKYSTIIYPDNNTVDAPMYGTGLGTWVAHSGSVLSMPVINDTTTAHTVSFVLTRLAAGLKMEYFLDGTLVQGGTDAAATNFTFNQIVMRGNTGNAFCIDDVQLVFSPFAVPESKLTASPADGADFPMGKLKPETAKTLTSAVTLSNSGPAGTTLGISAPVVSGSNLFSVTGYTEGMTLASGAEAVLGFVFAGSATPGVYTATVTIATNAASGPTTVSYDLSATVLQPGDTNGDFMVDFADYLNLESSFGGGPTSEIADADFDDNGVVEFADYLVLEANFGAGPAVPEPATLSLLGLGALALIRRR